MSSWVRDKQKFDASPATPSVASRSKSPSRQSPRPAASSPVPSLPASVSSRISSKPAQSLPPGLPTSETRSKSPVPELKPAELRPTPELRSTPEIRSTPEPRARTPTPRSDPKPSSLTSVQAKRAELNFKRFANRMELMTKKSLQEYFRLQELEGSHIIDRLFFAFGRTNSIDLSSFLAGIKELAKGSAKERAGFLFRMLDVKSTSIVDRNDLKKMLLSHLTAALSMEATHPGIAQAQTELRGEAAQDIEQAVDELVDEAVGSFGAHGSFLTLDQFQQYMLSDPAVARALSG